MKSNANPLYGEGNLPYRSLFQAQLTHYFPNWRWKHTQVTSHQLFGKWIKISFQKIQERRNFLYFLDFCWKVCGVSGNMSSKFARLPESSKLENAEIPNDNDENNDEFEDLELQNNDSTKLSVVQKPLHERHPLEFMVILIGASALSFNAGFVNGCTYQFRNIPVSHVTGTTTHAGMNLGNNDWDSFAVNFCIIVSFVFGCSITGFFMPENSFQLGRQYGPLFLIGSCLFAVACFTSYCWPDSNYYFYFAAMACGLQNAMTSKYSGNIIRTTHMTGTATDIGLVLGRVAKGDHKELWKLQVLCPIFAAFLFGGVISVPVFHRMGKLSLLINVLVFFGIGLAYSIVVGAQLHLPIWSAFFGTYIYAQKRLKLSRSKVKLSGSNMKQATSELELGTGVNPLHIDQARK